MVYNDLAESSVHYFTNAGLCVRYSLNSQGSPAMTTRLKSALIAEIIGSFALTFIGIMAIHYSGRGAGLLSVAIAHGLTLAIFVTATMAASGGHLNPAVTASFVVT